MQFFTKELLFGINACDEAVRISAENTWKKNALKYQEKFETIRQYLPSSFIKEYLNRKGFHDYIIQTLTLTQKGKMHSCDLQLTDGEETLFLTLSGVKVLKLDIETFDYYVSRELIWEYSEFDLSKEKNLLLSVLCNIENELQFEFESIDFASKRNL